MTVIAPRTSVAKRPHRVTLQNPGPPAQTGDGDYTQSWVDLSPSTLDVEILPASAQNLERVTAGTVLAVATHIVSGAYHPQITTDTRLLFSGRVFQVTGVSDPEERNIESVLLCVEVKQP